MKRTKNTKAQMISQVFIFILAGLIFVLIITYGYKAIQHFLARSEQAALLDFKSDLESAVESVKRDYGSVRKVELRLPTKFYTLCILDPEQCTTPTFMHPETRQSFTFNWMKDACETGSANAFIAPRELDISIPDVEVTGGAVCIPNIDGKVTLRMEGLGKKAKVSEWPLEKV